MREEGFSGLKRGLPPRTDEDERMAHRGRVGTLHGLGSRPGDEFEMIQASWGECTGQSYSEPAGQANSTS
jgi:hypothetical protein